MFNLMMASLLAAAPVAKSEPAPAIRVQFVGSETLSLVYFAETLVEATHRSTYLRPLFEAHGGNATLVGELRRALESGPPSLEYYLHEEGKPKERHLGAAVSDLLEAGALHASSLDDFGTRITGLLPLAEQSRLLKALRALEPLHRKAVWRAKALAESKRQLGKAWAKIDGDLLVTQMAHFYGADWPQDMPFTIGLIPIPRDGKNAQTNAHSAGPNEFVEVLENDDWPGRVGVIVHEIAHSFYAAQPPALQLRLEEKFATLNNGNLAYAFFNEAVATALGNGHAERVDGKLRDDSWYNDSTIDAFARAIYPLTAEYLSNQRVMDTEFIERAVERFNHALPDVDRKPKVVLRQVSLFTHAGGKPVRDALIRDLQANSIGWSQPLDAPETVAGYAEKRSTWLVFVLHDDELPLLGRYPFGKDVLPLLGSATEGSYYLATRQGDGAAKLFLVAPKNQPLEELVHAISKLEHLALETRQKLSREAPGHP